MGQRSLRSGAVILALALTAGLLSATSSGISVRHGWHQVAHTLSMTTLPRRDASDTESPVVVVAE